MQTILQINSNHNGFTKCGEILKSTSENYQNPYVLKCFQCKEIYLLLESFIFHMEIDCKGTAAVTPTACYTKERRGAYDNMELQNNKNEMQNGNFENVKVENENYMETGDPLIIVKSEITDFNNESYIKSNTKLAENQSVDMTKMENVAKPEESSEESCSIDTKYEHSDSEAKQTVYVKSGRKGNPYKKIDIELLMKSKTNISAFITAYKNQPEIWNQKHYTLRYKEHREKFLKRIAQELKNQVNLNMTLEQIATIIFNLNQKYREDLSGLKANAENEDKIHKYKTSWYFEELNFLKPIMENNIIAKLDTHLPELLPHEIIQILEIYKGFEHLWNTQIMEYYCNNKRRDALLEMLQSLETNMNLQISKDVLKDYLNTVHNCFFKAKKYKLDVIANKKSINEIEENKQDYYEHMIFLYDHVGPFKCSECECTFNVAVCYKIHKSKHHGSPPLSCPLCKKEFTVTVTYKTHIRRHMEDTKFDCKDCDKKFFSATDLKIHMRDHTGAKPFCCEICGSSFKHAQSFTSHHRRHLKQYVITCSICSKGFYKLDRYRDHMNVHTNTTAYFCPVCNKGFKCKTGVKQHSVIHKDIRKYVCKLCDKTFKHKNGVTQHMRTHGILKDEETIFFK